MRFVFLALAFAGCAANPIPKEQALQRSRDDVKRERHQDTVRQWQDDFNRATSDAN